MFPFPQFLHFTNLYQGLPDQSLNTLSTEMKQNNVNIRNYDTLVRKRWQVAQKPHSIVTNWLVVMGGCLIAGYAVQKTFNNWDAIIAAGVDLCNTAMNFVQVQILVCPLRSPNHSSLINCSNFVVRVQLKKYIRRLGMKEMRLLNNLELKQHIQVNYHLVRTIPSPTSGPGSKRFFCESKIFFLGFPPADSLRRSNGERLHT